MEQFITLKILQEELPNMGTIPPCINDNMSNPQQIYDWCMRIYYELTAFHHDIEVFNSDIELFNNMDSIGICLEDDYLAKVHKAIHAATLIALMYPIKMHSNDIQHFRLLYNLNTHCNQTYQSHKLTSLCFTLPSTNFIKNRYHELFIDIAESQYQELCNDKTTISDDTITSETTPPLNEESLTNDLQCKFTL